MAVATNRASDRSDRLTSLCGLFSLDDCLADTPMTTDDDRIKLEPSWKQALRAEFDQPYMHKLREFLRQEHAAGKQIYPPGPMIFNALNLTPLDQVKVVILGQDPYHGPGQAHGLCFSVQPGVPTPPSLVNVYKELQRDLNIDIARHGCLQHWAEQGVLLLNTTLTVERANAASHAKKGWERAPAQHGLPALGRACPKQAEVDRRHQASGADLGTPVATVGAQGLHRQWALQPHQQVPRAAWAGADRLAPAGA
jgi:hypothetical protein